MWPWASRSYLLDFFSMMHCTLEMWITINLSFFFFPLPYASLSYILSQQQGKETKRAFHSAFWVRVSPEPETCWWASPAGYSALVIFLPLRLLCWCYRCAPLYPLLCVFCIEPRSLGFHDKCCYPQHLPRTFFFKCSLQTIMPLKKT